MRGLVTEEVAGGLLALCPSGLLCRSEVVGRMKKGRCAHV